MRRISLFPAAIALLAATAISLPLRAPADDAAALLAKHRAFVGWQAADGTFSSLVFDGTTSHLKDGAEKVDTQAHEVRRGLAYRVTSKELQHNTSRADGFTGRVFWETNRNGFVHPVIGDAERYVIAEDLVFNEGVAGLTGTLKGNQTVRGTACTDVQVKIDASFPVNVCVDPQTGALQQAVIDPGGTYETTLDILKYSDVNGKKVISSWQYKNSKYTYRWTSITANAPVSDADLHPPAQTALWSFGSGRPIAIDVEHNDFERGIYVNAVFNGVPGRFLLDTGASGVALNRAYTGRMHLKPLYGSMSAGVTGLTKTELEEADTMQIGDNILSHVIVSTLDHDLFNGKVNNKEVDGLIGFDLFAAAIVNLDLDNQQLSLFDPSKMHVGDGNGIPVNVDLQELVPIIPMKVNGTIPIRALLDTGDLLNRGILLPRDLTAKYGLNMLAQNRQYVSGVGAGVSMMRCGVINSLSVGPAVYQTAPACEVGGSEDSSALVGFDFLQHFNMLFDYPEGRLVLIPRQNQ